MDPSVKIPVPPPIKEVIIDGLAVLKIVKHCSESMPTLVAGSLLGLDTNGKLEITYSYSFPQPKTDKVCSLSKVYLFYILI